MSSRKEKKIESLHINPKILQPVLDFCEGWYYFHLQIKNICISLADITLCRRFNSKIQLTPGQLGRTSQSFYRARETAQKKSYDLFWLLWPTAPARRPSSCHSGGEGPKPCPIESTVIRVSNQIPWPSRGRALFGTKVLLPTLPSPPPADTLPFQPLLASVLSCFLV